MIQLTVDRRGLAVLCRIQRRTSNSGKYLALLVAATGALRADIIGTVYTYTGNSYNVCAGTYCTGGPYALRGTFETTLTGTALDNLPFTDISSTIKQFSFSDGSGLIVNQNTPGVETMDLISTDGSGKITGWLTGGYANSGQVQLQTNWNSPYGFQPGMDFSETTASFAGSYGSINDDPGTWVLTGSVISAPGGPTSSPAFLISGTPVADIAGTIAGMGSQEFYGFGWLGGTFSATVSMTGTNPEASYVFSEGTLGTCDSASQMLSSGDGFTNTISIPNLAPGIYCIGINANSPYDPNFTLTFNTPVASLSTPEPPSLLLFTLGLAIVGTVAGCAGWFEPGEHY